MKKQIFICCLMISSQCFGSQEPSVDDILKQAEQQRRQVSKQDAQVTAVLLKQHNQAFGGESLQKVMQDSPKHQPKCDREAKRLQKELESELLVLPVSWTIQNSAQKPKKQRKKSEGTNLNREDNSDQSTASKDLEQDSFTASNR